MNLTPYLVGVLLISLAGCGVMGKLLLDSSNKNGKLKQEIVSQSEQIASISAQIEQAAKESAQDKEALDASIGAYKESISNASHTIESLQKELTIIKSASPEVAKCLSIIMPSSYVERLP